MFLILIPSAFWLFEAKAVNYLSGSIRMQIESGLRCGDVTRDDLKKSGITCVGKNPIEAFTMVNSADLYRKGVYEMAARDQLLKNACVYQTIGKLQEHPDKWKDWNGILVMAWLGARKAKLMLDDCQNKALKYIPEKDLAAKSLEQAYEDWRKTVTYGRNQIPALSKEEKALCLNEEKMGSLRIASEIFEHALPIISNKSLFSVVDQHRNLITKTSTGKPITDDDIRKMDMQNLSGLKLDLDLQASPAARAFDKDLKKELNHIRSMRGLISDDIESTLQKGSDFSDGLKDFLYADETLEQSMKAHGLLDRQYRSLLDPESQKKLSSGAACVLSSHESDKWAQRLNMVSGIAEFGAEAVAAGKLINGLKYLGLWTARKAPQIYMIFLPKNSGTFSVGAESARTATVTSKYAREAENFVGNASKKAEGQMVLREAYAEAKGALSTGALAMALPLMSRDIISSCLKTPIPGVSNKTMQVQKMIESNPQRQMQLLDTGKKLPQETGFTVQVDDHTYEMFPDISLDPESTPACQNREYTKLVGNEALDPNCVMHVMMNLMPMSIGRSVVMGEVMGGPEREEKCRQRDDKERELCKKKLSCESAGEAKAECLQAVEDSVRCEGVSSDEAKMDCLGRQKCARLSGDERSKCEEKIREDRSVRMKKEQEADIQRRVDTLRTESEAKERQRAEERAQQKSKSKGR